MIDRNAYPQPRVNSENSVFLRAWQDESKLLLPICEVCGTEFFYPRPMCPHCWSDMLGWKESSGTGTIVSFATVYVANDPVFSTETPTVFAEIRLDSGTLMLARVLVNNVTDIVEGMAVKLVGPDDAKGLPLPTFESAGGS